jgi:uncharacterized protein with PIN domain
MCPEDPADQKFIADRMLGTLTRYLRFMGYDTASANDLAEGDVKEDTVLLGIAKKEHRLLLTKDAELARRGGDSALLVRSDDVMEQLQQLIDRHLVRRRIVLSRCSLCNTRLREANTCEIESASYAPKDWRNLTFYWCRQCGKLYWNGSHGRQLEDRLAKELKER